jgi:hypothetical protein
MVLQLEAGTLWLNVMNVFLGVLTAASLVAVVVVTVRSVWHPKLHLSRSASAEWLGPLTNVGLTMADGGEPVDKQSKKTPSKPA